MKKLVLFTLFALNLVEQPAPEVAIEQGVLSGKISTDGTYYEYLGIPYATVNERFQAPGPPQSWEGVYRAVDDIYVCPQNTPIGVIGSEDCLKINIYVPAMTRRPLAVMVWIHGGAFVLGNGGKNVYGPEFIVKKDVIVVTFNYRLGALGFMCLGIEEAPGNAGIKDQIAALRWVKNNIAAFGGNPDNITLFGESAGATSVSILLASETTKGLFNRAIVQSGSAISNRAINLKPVQSARLLAKELGYNTDDLGELYKIFSKMNYKDLIGIKVKNPLDSFMGAARIHLPCIEKVIPGVESVINDSPYNILAKNPKDLPIIYGSTSKEGLFFVREKIEAILDQNETNHFSDDLRFPSKEVANDLSMKVNKFYFGDDKISIEKVMNLSDLYTQLYFELPVIMETKLYLNKIKSPVYNYIFNYSGSRNFVKQLSGFGQETGACHGDDLGYLFNQFFLPFKVNKDDGRIINHMTSMWTNFAKYGDPTPELEDLPVRWEPSTRENLKFLYIDEDMRIGDMPNPKAYQLWKHIYDNYRLTDIR